MRINIIIAVAIALLFIWCIVKIKKYHMDFKLGLPWLVGLVVLFVLDIFPDIVTYLTKLAGIELPINLLFLVAIALCMILLFRQSMEISKLKDEHRTLAQELALKECREANVVNDSNDDVENTDYEK